MTSTHLDETQHGLVESDCVVSGSQMAAKCMTTLGSVAAVVALMAMLS